MYETNYRVVDGEHLVQIRTGSSFLAFQLDHVLGRTVRFSSISLQRVFQFIGEYSHARTTRQRQSCICDLILPSYVDGQDYRFTYPVASISVPRQAGIEGYLLNYIAKNSEIPIQHTIEQQYILRNPTPSLILRIICTPSRYSAVQPTTDGKHSAPNTVPDLPNDIIRLIVAAYLSPCLTFNDKTLYVRYGEVSATFNTDLAYFGRVSGPVRDGILRQVTMFRHFIAMGEIPADAPDLKRLVFTKQYNMMSMFSLQPTCIVLETSGFKFYLPRVLYAQFSTLLDVVYARASDAVPYRNPVQNYAAQYAPTYYNNPITGGTYDADSSDYSEDES